MWCSPIILEFFVAINKSHWQEKTIHLSCYCVSCQIVIPSQPFRANNVFYCPKPTLNTHELAIVWHWVNFQQHSYCVILSFPQTLVSCFKNCVFLHSWIKHVVSPLLHWRCVSEFLMWQNFVNDLNDVCAPQ